MLPRSITATADRWRARRLGEVRSELLTKLISEQPPAEEHQPLDPELFYLPTMEAKVNRVIERHAALMGNWQGLSERKAETPQTKEPAPPPEEKEVVSFVRTKKKRS
jgi:hypothetical protein